MVGHRKLYIAQRKCQIPILTVVELLHPQAMQCHRTITRCYKIFCQHKTVACLVTVYFWENTAQIFAYIMENLADVLTKRGTVGPACYFLQWDPTFDIPSQWNSRNFSITHLHGIYVMKVILHMAAVWLCFCSFDCNICRDCRVQVPLHCVSSACQPDRWKRTIAREYRANIYRLVNNSVQWHFSSECVLWEVRSPNFAVRSDPVDCWLSYLCVFTDFCTF